jgi:hypothetical protein
VKAHQFSWAPEAGFRGLPLTPDETSQLILLFGAAEAMEQGEKIARIRELYPRAAICGCSTAGEIEGIQVRDGSLSGTAIYFEHTEVRVVSADVVDADRGRGAGRALGDLLAGPGLVHVLVFSDGLNVNGSELTVGLREALPSDVAVTGGLSADGDRFERTVVCADATPREGQICAVGLYGDRLRVGYGSLGGWDPFGPERIITRADGNVLHELDGRSALGLYKEYLGEFADGLPATGLLFPLSVRGTANDERRVVRTVLSVDDEADHMTFAGDLPEGHLAQLMKANFERLIEGAEGAARHAQIDGSSPTLALLISCVGRRLVLKQRTEEEIEVVRHILGDGTTLTGFYSYGEICPSAPNAACDLHNQTMTITTFEER